MDKVTKESLSAENAVLKARIEAMKAEQNNIAHYLSVALGAGTQKKSDYGHETEQIVYSWFTIFREIGKLLERKDQTELQEELRRAIERCYKMEEKIWRLENPNKEPDHVRYDHHGRRLYFP